MTWRFMLRHLCNSKIPMQDYTATLPQRSKLEGNEQWLYSAYQKRQFLCSSRVTQWTFKLLKIIQLFEPLLFSNFVEQEIVAALSLTYPYILLRRMDMIASCERHGPRDWISVWSIKSVYSQCSDVFDLSSNILFVRRSLWSIICDAALTADRAAILEWDIYSYASRFSAIVIRKNNYWRLISNRGYIK